MTGHGTLEKILWEIRSAETAVPKLGGSVDFSLWKMRVEGFALSHDCMQDIATDVDMPAGERLVFSSFRSTEVLVRQAQDEHVLLGHT